MLIDLDGERITATSFGGRWGFVIDVEKDEDVEQYEIDAWDIGRASQPAP